jgi:hypothetical protein
MKILYLGQGHGHWQLAVILGYDDAIFDSVMHYSFGQKIVLHLEDFNATM